MGNNKIKERDFKLYYNYCKEPLVEYVESVEDVEEGEPKWPYIVKPKFSLKEKI